MCHNTVRVSYLNYHKTEGHRFGIFGDFQLKVNTYFSKNCKKELVVNCN